MNIRKVSEQEKGVLGATRLIDPLFQAQTMSVSPSLQSVNMKHQTTLMRTRWNTCGKRSTGIAMPGQVLEAIHAHQQRILLGKVQASLVQVLKVNGTSRLDLFLLDVPAKF